MKTATVLGRRLTQRADGFWIDDSGTIFDWRYGKLYEQRAPGVWFWIKPPLAERALERSTRVPRDSVDALLDSLEVRF